MTTDPEDLRRPENLGDLFHFYHGYVKLLYCESQTRNQLSNEILFEVNAAFDHLSRIWVYGEDEREVVSKVYSHLKRICLDVFKLKLKDTRDQYKKLLLTDTSIIDNGKFDTNLHQLMSRIRNQATEARRREGQPDHNGGLAQAFDLWQEVYKDCEMLQSEFFLNPSLDWAKRKNRRKRLRDMLYGFLVGGVLVGLTQTFLVETIWPFLKGLFVSPKP